ncbi:MAG TPA: hypothetical protein VMJ12_09485 [Candidatus Acidoferrales bacterium]|nr:hypothetical protein [Candidatus Acidoferrales bacterium]
MTAAEFKREWARYHGKETSAYQEHFADLYRLLGQPTPNEADPSSTDFFCYSAPSLAEQASAALEKLKQRKKAPAKK